MTFGKLSGRLTNWRMKMTKPTPVISKETLITTLDVLDDLMEGLKCSSCSKEEWTAVYNSFVELNNYLKDVYNEEYEEEDDTHADSNRR